ncbi:hypothetical protein GGI02_001840 [Coemansia sp. RSA 2322]|nr:hypothetical protein GGI02_001840 [Coemansia sp. RSA 2322]
MLVELDAEHNKSATAAMYRRLRAMDEHLLQDHAIAIPDISLEGLSPAVFNTEVSTVYTDEDEQVTFQSVCVATRPHLVAQVRDTVIAVGQTRQKFRGITPPVTNSASLVGSVVRLGNDSNTKQVAGSDILLISGVRHIGKSHVMFQVAALLLATEPSHVAVLYVSTGSSLVLNGDDDDELKHWQFVDHAVRAFVPHDDLAAPLAAQWRQDVGGGQVLATATAEFVDRVSDASAQKDITIVLFIDEYEALHSASQTVLDVHKAAGTWTVVTSVSDTAKFSLSGTRSEYSHLQCTLPAAGLRREEAESLALIYNSTDYPVIGKAGLELLFAAAEFHPLDIARALAGIGETDMEVGDLISDMRLARDLRVTELHARFVQAAMDHALENSPQQEAVVRTGDCGELISVEQTAALRRIKREIQRAVFAIYHSVTFSHGSLSSQDPQFTSGVECFPLAAAELLYRFHFPPGASVDDQFGWLFDSVVAQSKYDVEPSIRLRYFDLLLLESRRLPGIGGRPDVRFTHVPVFSDLEGRRVEPAQCRTFAEAGAAVHAYCDAVASTNRTCAAMLHFPRLGLQEPWMSAETRARSHFAGSFMALVPAPSPTAVVWVAVDPLHSASSQIPSSQTTESRALRTKAAEPSDHTAARAPKDTEDYDTLFGSGASWSAKALALLPDVQRHSGLPGSRMVALAADTRSNIGTSAVIPTSALAASIRARISAHV